jgi:hypothetical protein
VARGLSLEEFERIKSEQVIDQNYTSKRVITENESKSKSKTDITPIGPETSSFISRLLWLWVSELVSIANRTPLTDAHLGDCPKSSLCDNVLDKFNKQWDFQKDTKPKPSIVAALFGTFSSTAWMTGFTELLIKTSQLVVPVVVQLLLKWCKYLCLWVCMCVFIRIGCWMLIAECIHIYLCIYIHIAFDI